MIPLGLGVFRQSDVGASVQCEESEARVIKKAIVAKRQSRLHPPHPRFYLIAPDTLLHRPKTFVTGEN